MTTSFAMIDSIKNDQPAQLPTNVSPLIKELIGKLLDKNPDNRPDAEKLVNKTEI